jgi:hypothetical protein
VSTGCWKHCYTCHASDAEFAFCILRGLFHLYYVLKAAFDLVSAGLHQPAPGYRIKQTSIRMLGWTTQHRMLASPVLLLYIKKIGFLVLLATWLLFMCKISQSLLATFNLDSFFSLTPLPFGYARSFFFDVCVSPVCSCSLWAGPCSQVIHPPDVATYYYSGEWLGQSGD